MYRQMLLAIELSLREVAGGSFIKFTSVIFFCLSFINSSARMVLGQVSYHAEIHFTTVFAL